MQCQGTECGSHLEGDPDPNKEQIFPFSIKVNSSKG